MGSPPQQEDSQPGSAASRGDRHLIQHSYQKGHNIIQSLALQGRCPGGAQGASSSRATSNPVQAWCPLPPLSPWPSPLYPTVLSLCWLHQQLTAQDVPGGHGGPVYLLMLPHPQPRALGMQGSLQSHLCARLLLHPWVPVGWDWTLMRVRSSHGRRPSLPCPAVMWTLAVCSVRRLNSSLRPGGGGATLRDAHRETGRHT